MTKQHNEDARRLLKLMGVPVVEAPCEAEAQCAELVKTGKVFATATEDMDALTFGSTVLLRNMFSKTQGNQTQNVKVRIFPQATHGTSVTKVSVNRPVH